MPSMRRLKDLQAMPVDQRYLCTDPEVARRHRLSVPFACGCRRWVGSGLVQIQLYSADPEIGALYQVWEDVAITTLQPIPGATWAFDDP